MTDLNKIIGQLELAQIGWVVPDIAAAATFLSASLNVTGFPDAEHVLAQDLSMSYMGNVVPAEWLTTQTYSGGKFIELVQPLSGQSMFADYIAKVPMGGVQHMAYRLPESGFEDIREELVGKGLEIISEVDHPIARMVFFDTYALLGMATEIMGITRDGWEAIEQMKG